MHVATHAGKKKGAKKKKGLSLTPEQTHNLVRITGALKFLCLVRGFGVCWLRTEVQLVMFQAQRFTAHSVCRYVPA